MINIKIDEDDIISLLDERVKFWTDDETTAELFHKMYENLIYGGCFNGGELDVMKIVDNDYVNWCGVVSEGDDNFDKCREAWNSGKYECDDFYIEAEYNGSYLIRWY